MVLICAFFTSCMGNTQTTVTVEGDVKLNDTDGISQTDLNNIAKFVANNEEAYQGLVAAYRGYDILNDTVEEGKVYAPIYETVVDDEGNETEILKVNVDAAKAVLAKHDTKNTLDYEKLDREDVINLVEKLKQNVTFEAKKDFLNSIMYGIGVALGWITNTLGFGNYIIGICIFAIFLEILMLPMAISRQKNSIKQAKLRPKEMAIRKKYAGRNDQVTMQKMNQEIQKLYQDEGYNPMGGCLPLLIQMPIVIALYNIVIDPLRYVLGLAESLSSALSTYCTAARAAGGLGLELGTGKGTIELLSQLGGGQLEGLRNFAFFANREECFNALNNLPELNFNLFGLNMGIIPGFRQPFVLLLIPVLTFAFYFASMKLTRKFTYQPVTTDPQMGCSNNMMDITMPLMSVYITFIVPAAVGIYWIFKCIISTVKQFVIHKAMPLPTFTEEDYKAAERELKGKTKHEKKPAGERTSPSGKKVRSLHHIDDDDEPLPPSVPEKKEDPAKSEQPAGQEEKKNDMRAPMKDDRKDDEKK